MTSLQNLQDEDLLMFGVLSCSLEVNEPRPTKDLSLCQRDHTPSSLYG